MHLIGRQPLFKEGLTPPQRMQLAYFGLSRQGLLYVGLYIRNLILMKMMNTYRGIKQKRRIRTDSLHPTDLPVILTINSTNTYNTIQFSSHFPPLKGKKKQRKSLKDYKNTCIMIFIYFTHTKSYQN